MNDATTDLQRLEELGESPFPPTPPRRSRIVDAFMRRSLRGNTTRLETPHLHGGTAMDKVRYEHAAADAFWESFEGAIDSGVLEGCDVLDIGCGWGGKMVSYAESTRLRSIHGFDLPGLISLDAPRAFARERGVEDRCTFAEGRAEEIPYEDARFDIAMMDDVLEHVEDPERVLRECERVLRPGGLLLVKFPSLRMIRAHHLDRAISYPGLHYLLPLRTWAAGLNHYLLHGDPSVSFEPFDEIVDTRYRRGVTRNLSGLDVSSFRRLITASRFEPLRLEIVGMGFGNQKLKQKVARRVHRAVTSVPALREVLGRAVSFVGRRQADPT